MIFFFSIFVLTVPRMERYCSCLPNIITFRTSHEKGFLVFGVPNAKYLTFGTPDRNALRYIPRQVYVHGLPTNKSFRT